MVAPEIQQLHVMNKAKQHEIRMMLSCHAQAGANGGCDDDEDHADNGCAHGHIGPAGHSIGDAGSSEVQLQPPFAVAVCVMRLPDFYCTKGEVASHFSGFGSLGAGEALAHAA